MCHPARRVGSQHGFTIVELLVVMSMLAVLVSLLLPALARAKEATDQVRCLSRLRQLGLAATLYQQDHEGVYPRPMRGEPQADDPRSPDRAQRDSALWFNAVDVYLLSSLEAEGEGEVDAAELERHKQDPVHATFPAEVRGSNRTLKMNRYFVDEQANRPRYFAREAQVREASRTVMFVDGRAFDIRPTDTISAARYDLGPSRVALRHDAAANVAFADGHAEAVEQPVRGDLVAPAWYPAGHEDQRLVWDFVGR